MTNKKVIEDLKTSRRRKIIMKKNHQNQYKVFRWKRKTLTMNIERAIKDSTRAHKEKKNQRLSFFSNLGLESHDKALPL